MSYANLKISLDRALNIFKDIREGKQIVGNSKRFNNYTFDMFATYMKKEIKKFIETYVGTVAEFEEELNAN